MRHFHLILLLLALVRSTAWAADPMEASLRAKADFPWFAQFMVGEPIVEGFPGESATEKTKRMQPWRDAKFGLFLHWGPQRAGGEYVIQKETLDAFNPVKFDAEKWVLTAKALGFRYIVFTAKHHAGFSMFDSAATTHDIVDATPFKRDPLKELADACAKHDLLLGIYYSVWDLHHPDYGKDTGNPNYAKYHQFMLDQTTELLTKYGPIVTLWLDGEWVPSWTVERAIDLRNHVRQLQPNIMLVDRIGQRRVGDGDYGSSENFSPYIGDLDRPWESCQKFDGGWFYNGTDKSQTVEWALRNLIHTVARGGNFLMNLGPTPEGELLATSVAKLQPLSDWLRQNGEAIYGAQKGPHFFLEWGECSRRGNTLYYFVSDWPRDGQLMIPGLNAGQANAGIKQISFLANAKNTPLAFNQAGGDVHVKLPVTPPYALVNVLKVELNGLPVVDNAVRALTSALPARDAMRGVPAGGYFLSAAFAQIHGDKLHFSLGSGAGAQRENLKDWTEESDWAQWNILAQQPGTYNVEVTYASWLASGEFEVEINGQKFRHTVVPSKPPAKKSPLMVSYRTVTVGPVALKQPGRYDLSVKPINITTDAKKYHQGLMVLRDVTLTPIQPN